ncbi:MULTISPECIES: ATP-binding protein [unclassified Streptomyces]|uniref:ATP-binding protein n=1 Tax=unclassified Streptomyces TaxID=2593676 RepID=UPI00093DE9AD|nr:ATP-binding protein [Streptomyces sp. CB02400]OKK02064.1 PAS sensor protein [Streptomyces sp. CB02400]
MTSSNDITFRLPRSRRSVPRARALLHAVLGDWGVGQETLDNAELVLSELVTNALRVPAPGDRQVGVRISRSVADGLLRIEVSDAGGGRPEVREPGEDETGGRGLLLVAALAHRWGYETRPAGIGKTVFAELKAPDIVAAPEVREVAAVMVRAGQEVRVWGGWRTVLRVRSEQYAAGGPAVVLEFDSGPALRVHAAEPLAVRTGVRCR